MKKRCYIAGAGEWCGRFLPGEDDYIIAADAGYAALMDKGIEPDLVVGDFDSLGSLPEHPNVICSPTEKDDTDMMLAVRHGLARGFKDFIIDGGLGGRLDHTLANIQVIKEISKHDAIGIMVGQDICVTAVTNAAICFAPGATGTVSVFASSGKAEGVTLTGLKYTLSDATLLDYYPIGVSNEFTDEPATITVTNGTLIVTWTGDPGSLFRSYRGDNV